MEHQSLWSATGMPHSMQTRILGFDGFLAMPNRRCSNDMPPPAKSD
jgi:hypothetical protein